tara:strand:+ start:399 stop:956 length:558 start_codon:yes stop_codon:yes gene_type:complete
MSEYNKRNEDEMKNFGWLQHIKEVFAGLLYRGFDFESPDSDTEKFLMAVWSANAHAPLNDRIEVIVDSSDALFIIDGSKYERNDDIKKDIVGSMDRFGELIRIPIKCYITIGDHGKSSLRKEDWMKIKSGFGFLDSCIFLGNNEYLVLQTKEEKGEQFTYLAKKVFYGLLSEEIETVTNETKEWI